MLVPRTFTATVRVPSADINLEELIATTPDDRTRLAYACLMSFYQDDRDALMAGVYTIRVRRNFVGVPSYMLTFQNDQEAA